MFIMEKCLNTITQEKSVVMLVMDKEVKMSHNVNHVKEEEWLKKCYNQHLVCINTVNNHVLTVEEKVKNLMKKINVNNVKEIKLLNKRKSQKLQLNLVVLMITITFKLEKEMNIQELWLVIFMQEYKLKHIKYLQEKELIYIQKNKLHYQKPLLDLASN